MSLNRQEAQSYFGLPIKLVECLADTFSIFGGSLSERRKKVSSTSGIRMSRFISQIVDFFIVCSLYLSRTKLVQDSLYTAEQFLRLKSKREERRILNKLKAA